MKSFLLTASLLVFSFYANSQNVGIGLSSGINARLHVAKADSGVVIVENTAFSDDSVKTRLYFKTDGYFTGGIGTHITSGGGGTPFARMGLFTFGNSDPTKLKERLSISDAGNIGIGTVAPSALLDVNGSFRLRGNGFGIGKVLTSDANGYGTWQVQSLPLPFSGTASSATSVFEVTNSSSSGNSIAIKGTGYIGLAGFSNIPSAGIGVLASSTSGFGLAAESNTGYAIQATTGSGIAGRFTGNSGYALVTSGKLGLGNIGEGAGKVLTSDATGNATWQSPVSASNNTAFAVGTTIATSINNTFSATVPFNNELSSSYKFDDGNSFNTSTYAYVAPAAGVYFFNASVALKSGTATSDGYVSIRFFNNGFSNNTPDANLQTFAGKPLPVSGSVSTVLKLDAGDAVTVNVFNSSGGTVMISNVSANTHFFGYRLY